MLVLRGCKMISLDTYGGKGRVLLGFLLLASCVPLVRTTDYLSLNATTTQLKVGDRLVPSNQSYFEFGIFQYNYSDDAGSNITSYYLAIRYALPTDRTVVWIADRDTALNSNSVLQFDASRGLQLSDQQNTNNPNGWSTFKDNPRPADINSAELLDSGKLELKDKNGTVVWNSFDDSPPTDTLLPGQRMNRSQGYSLKSWHRSGNSANANDTYTFGWDTRGVLTLSWTCPFVFLNWKGGPYIPAPDVYAAHTIQDVDSIYFHETLGHLYINSKPPTAILSGGPDLVNNTTLKRITMSPDGGLRIWQYSINQDSNQSWIAVANWVVSDRPDSRSQCTTFGTCGQFSQCVSALDDLKNVSCQCPGKDKNETMDWFKAINNDAARGCTAPTQMAKCLTENGTYGGDTSLVGMLPLPGVDMPWGGDYRNLTGSDSTFCMQRCKEDCYCAGAVYSQAEQMCWMKNKILFNLGYPTEALHGTDRTSYLRNESVLVFHQPQAAKKDNKWVEILVPAVGISGVLLIMVVGFCLVRNFKRPPPADVMEFPGDS